jgi:hypothetical protein
MALQGNPQVEIGEPQYDAQIGAYILHDGVESVPSWLMPSLSHCVWICFRFIGSYD